MLSKHGADPLAPPGAPELDELQQGEEKPVTVENLEPPAQALMNHGREVPIPDPGERPGAVRLDKTPADRTG